jgi:FixJ family two-component response regulator
VDANLPVIILTGYGDDPDLMEAAKRLQNVCVLQKPWNTEILLKAIREMVASRNGKLPPKPVEVSPQ